MGKETPLAAIKRLTGELHLAEGKIQALEAVCREQEAQLKQVTRVTERLRQAEEQSRIWESLCRERDALFRSAEKLVCLLASERNDWQEKAEALQTRLAQWEAARHPQVRSRHAHVGVRYDELLAGKQRPHQVPVNRGSNPASRKGYAE